MKKTNNLSFFYSCVACFIVLLLWDLLVRYGAAGGNVIPGPIDTVLGVWAVFFGGDLTEHPAAGFLGIETRDYLMVLFVLLVSLFLLRLKPRKTRYLLSSEPEDFFAPKEFMAKESVFAESECAATQCGEYEIKRALAGEAENEEFAGLFEFDRGFSKESITGDQPIDDDAVGFESAEDIQPDKIYSQYAGPVERALQAYFGSNKNFIKKNM